MASGPIGRDDGTKEKQRPTERKVYTRKAFKGPKKDLNAANTVASAIAGSKIDKATGASEVAKGNGINKSIVQGSNANEAKSNSDIVLTEAPALQQVVLEDGNSIAEPLVISGLGGGNLAQPPEPQQVVPEDRNSLTQLAGSLALDGRNLAQPLEPQQVVPDDENFSAQRQGSSELEGGNLAQPQLEHQNTAQPLAPKQVVPEDSNLTAQSQRSLELEGGISALSQLEDENTAQTPAPQQVVLEDGNSETQPQLEGGNLAKPQLEDQNTVQPQESSGLEDGNFAQSQLEDQNKARLQVSSVSEGENLARLQLEDQNTAQLQGSSGSEDGSSAQSQLEDQNKAHLQVHSELEGDSSAHPQLEDQNTAQPRENSGLEDSNSVQPQFEDQNKGQLQVRLDLEGDNLVQPQFEGQNTLQPQESSGLEDGNSAQPQLEDKDTVLPQVTLGLEDGSLTQPQESTGIEAGVSAQPQLEDQNTAQLQVSSGLEDGHLAQPLLGDRNMTQPPMEDQDITPSRVNTRMKDGDTTQAQVSSRLEDRNSPRPEVTSRLEDQDSHQPQMDSIMEDADLPWSKDDDTAQAQVSLRLGDGNSPQPQVTSRLEYGDSHQPQMDSIMEDANLPQPEMTLELEDRNSLQPGVDSILEEQTLPQQHVNSRMEDGSLVQPPVVLVSDDSGSHQQEEPTSLNIQREDNRPSGPGHQQAAVPSIRGLTLGNGDVEPRLKDRIKINLASKSKQEMQELRWKLQSELDIVRNLVKRIEVKQKEVGGYSNLNVLVGDRVGAKRAHSEVASAGVPRENSRPLNQLSFSMLENSQGISENVEKEKRTPKANQFYRNSEFLLAKDKFPPAESNKKSKSNWKKQAGGEMGHGFGMGSKFFKSCNSLLEKLMKHKHGWVFNAPVDVEGLGLHDYFTIITHPMDLGTVKSRLNKNWYKSPKEFAEDVRLTFRNAMTYNPKGQDVHIMAEQLSKIFEDRWAIIESDYNREMRYGFDYGAAPPAPSPMSRKVTTFTPPPLDMRRILDRSEPFTHTPRPMSITPSSRTPAPKKPKAKDPHKRDMTFDEKQKLSTNLQSLPSEKLDAVVQIIKKRNSALNQHDDEIEVDIDSVDAETLWELDRFVTNYKKSLSKNKRKAELARARAEALQNAMQKSQALPMIEIPKETQAVERNVPPTLPVQGGNQADNGSRSSSSSSSSSDSGSSSSDSDSDSSSASGSDPGSQGT